MIPLPKPFLALLMLWHAWKAAYLNARIIALKVLRDYHTSENEDIRRLLYDDKE